MRWPWNAKTKKHDKLDDLDVIQVHEELSEIMGDLKYSLGRLDQVVSSLSSKRTVTTESSGTNTNYGEINGH